MTDPLGRVTESGYDDRGRKIFTISPIGAKTDHVYVNAGGLLTSRTWSDPARIVNHYDALHRRVKKEVFEDDISNWVLVRTHTFIYDG